jgi:hypothetical protein
MRWSLRNFARNLPEIKFRDIFRIFLDTIPANFSTFLPLKYHV